MNNIVAARIKYQFNLEKWNDKDTLSTWYGRLLSYQTKLQGSAKAINNQDIAEVLLMGLSEKWSTVCKQIMATQPELDLGNVISTLETNNEIVNTASTANTTASGTGNTDTLIATEGLREKPFQCKGNGNSNDNGKGKNKGKR